VTDFSTTTTVVAPRRPADPALDASARPVETAQPRLWPLDALRIAAITGVVAIHVIGYLVVNDRARGSAAWWAAVAVDLGSHWVVPVFVMISGALVLAPRAHAAGVGAFYRRRFIRILPALVVWHLVYLVGVRVLLRGERISRTGLLTMVVDGKVFTALYFLWLIIGLYAVGPVLAAFLHGGGRRRAMFLAGGALSWTLVAWTLPRALHAAGINRPMSIGAWTLWWPYVGYFVAGWALHRIVLGRRGLVVAALVAVVALGEIVWQYGTRGMHPRLDALLPLGYISLQTATAAIAIFLFALGAGARLRPSPRTLRALRRLSEASFGVFLVHLVFVEIARQTIPAVAAADSLAVLGVTLVCVLAVSFTISILASRIPYLRAIF
jgi:surface polysaccharide O-acyltransferase-like enzyme